jgi:uroporphyrin-III C-methyltransferase / precorrin-2 dehydrogenase / sirohydrochlorin ferrochelatase
MTAIAALATLPLFHKMRGRKTVVVGRSAAAAWKAELLAAAGAYVLRRARDWTQADLEGATLAVADLPGAAGERFAAAARTMGALVNVIDRPELCDVRFGSIVNRSSIIIGISTDGAAPVLAQSIRHRIERMLPPGLSNWAKVAQRWRPQLKRLLRVFPERRAFWQNFAAAAWAQPERPPSDSEFEGMVKSAREPRGNVTLVGAGPGDPELLTLKALRALERATVILHDQLVGPDVLELARREARRIAVGKTGHAASCKQSEINALMVDLALAGEQVVRLKGGDPMIFGRAAEEIYACRAAGLEVSVVPGISAAQGAASALLLPLTERRHARRVQFVACHGVDGGLPSDLDWLSVADRKSTSVLYMPRRTLGDFVRLAVQNGLDPATPALAIASATLPQEAHVAGEVAEIGALAGALPAGAPVTVIVGWAARHHVTRTGSPSRVPLALAS